MSELLRQGQEPIRNKTVPDTFAGVSMITLRAKPYGGIDVMNLAPTSKNLFRKWEKWLDRLGREFVELMIQQRHFHELRALTEPYIGEDTGWELARSMAQGYLAFAVTAIRRIAEPAKNRPVPKNQEIISIPILLEDLKVRGGIVTRKRQRERYKRAMKALPERISKSAADRAHNKVTRGLSTLRPKVIETDLKSVKRAVGRISVLADKMFAHVERDRRRIPRRISFARIDEAIRRLYEISNRYSLCLFGRDLRIPDLELHSIEKDLRKLWPKSGPLPEMPGVQEAFEL